MDGSSEQKAKLLLRNAGLKLTGQRLGVLGAVLEAGVPVTHEQIESSLGKEAPNRVTIYRILDSLVEAGLVHRVFLGERTWHFEGAHNCSEEQCHPHFTCTCCNETHCFTGMDVPAPPGRHKGFVIRHQSVRFDGLCPDCSRNRHKAYCRAAE